MVPFTPSIYHAKFVLQMADEDVPVEGAADSDEGIPQAMETLSPPRSFAKLARSATFTFPLPSVNSTQPSNLKRPKDHPDGPTPNASPEKKRAREVHRDRSPPPPLNFDTSPPASTSLEPQSMPPSDIFGTIHSKLTELSEQQSSPSVKVVAQVRIRDRKREAEPMDDREERKKKIAKIVAPLGRGEALDLGHLHF